MTEQNLGKLHGVYGIAPLFLQRAAVVAFLAFVFFFLMLIAFSMWKSIGYFLLAMAFLVIQIFTLTGWIMQKRAEVRLYENGFTYKKYVCRWDEIGSVRVNKRKDSTVKDCEIEKKTGEKIVLTEAIQHLENIVKKIESEFNKRNQ